MQVHFFSVVHSIQLPACSLLMSERSGNAAMFHYIDDASISSLLVSGNVTMVEEMASYSKHCPGQGSDPHVVLLLPHRPQSHLQPGEGTTSYAPVPFILEECGRRRRHFLSMCAGHSGSI